MGVNLGDTWSDPGCSKGVLHKPLISSNPKGKSHKGSSQGTLAVPVEMKRMSLGEVLRKSWVIGKHGEKYQNFFFARFKNLMI